jgi:hypothetical protein
MRSSRFRPNWVAAAVLVSVGLISGPAPVLSDVIQTVDPGPGEINWTTPWAPPNVEGTPGFIDFEGLAEGQALGEVIPGVKFTTTQGQDWLVGTWSSNNYNGKYPGNGAYTSQGDGWTWLGPSQGGGIIEFTRGKATYVSFLTSTFSGVTVDAYDADGQLIANGGRAASNLNTGAMSRISVISPFRNISYVVVHDSGNYWVLDSLSTDAPGVGHELAVPSFKQYVDPWKDDEMVPGSTIKQIGCAMTSVAMVLGSYGIATVDIGDPGSPDEVALDPGSLNTWLVKHDGYTAGGAIKWNKIDVLSAGTVVYDGGADVVDFPLVNGDLEMRRPVILREPGHFVVARGKHVEDPADETKNYFLIRDPGHDIDALNDPEYGNQWLGYRRYQPGDGVIRPALTVRMHSPAALLVTDAQGHRAGYDAASGGTLLEIPGSSRFEDGAIDDLFTGSPAVPGHEVVYLSNADSGVYEVTVIGTGTGSYELELEFRDAAAEYRSLSIEGTTTPGKLETYRVVTAPADASSLLIRSSGSLQGAGTVGAQQNRFVLVAQVSSDGVSATGTIRIEFPGTGKVALSTAIGNATFQEGVANVSSVCTYAGIAGHTCSVVVKNVAGARSAGVTVTDANGAVVYSSRGALNGTFRIAK